MIRRFNYTRRKRIEHQKVTIALQETGAGSPPTFTATLDLAELELPPDARLVITARRGRAAMRFDWGTAGAPTPPPDCRLSAELDNPSFRVMAQDDTGRILAMADRINPQRAGGQDSMLYLKEEELGQEVWRLDFSGAGKPTLLVNREIAGISAAMRHDDALRGLVLPEVLRAVLSRALIVDAAAPDDTEGDWSNWLDFVGSFHSTADYPGIDSAGHRDKSEVSNWIDAAVDTFTRERFRASELYSKARER